MGFSYYCACSRDSAIRIRPSRIVRRIVIMGVVLWGLTINTFYTTKVTTLSTYENHILMRGVEFESGFECEFEGFCRLDGGILGSFFTKTPSSPLPASLQTQESYLHFSSPDNRRLFG